MHEKNNAQESNAKSIVLIIIGAACLIGLAAFVYFNYYRTPVPTALNSEIETGISSQQQLISENEEEMPKVPANIPPLSGQYPASTQEKISILREILGSHNDNDSRLDGSFNALTKEDKAALREQYKSLPREARNELGTIIFILGRNQNDETDQAFFKEVLSEKPCLGLEDCSRELPATPGEAAHEETGLDTTLNYPQIVVLQSKLNALESAASPQEKERLKKEAYELIQIAKRTGVPAIQQKAEELEAAIGS